jgi:lipid A ethanolaminephosphotransferase
MRNHRELRHVFAPTNFLNATFGYLREQRPLPRKVEPLGLDARKVPAVAPTGRSRLLVLAIGETARGANFSLGGYPRPTNPELALQDVLYFTDVHSSGTATSTSLPCMFSNLGRKGFSSARAKSQENLLDVLAHAGLDVLWRENNSGCKGACERIPYEEMTRRLAPELCGPSGCYDEILLTGLQERLDRTAGDLVVVLHMHGSHGPGYHLRYPPEFETFTPACRTVALEDCSRAELVNAYDNTIVYSDHVLARTIELLRRNAQRFDAALLYVSDHGESLG